MLLNSRAYLQLPLTDNAASTSTGSTSTNSYDLQPTRVVPWVRFWEDLAAFETSIEWNPRCTFPPNLDEQKIGDEAEATLASWVDGFSRVNRVSRLYNFALWSPKRNLPGVIVDKFLAHCQPDCACALALLYPIVCLCMQHLGSAAEQSCRSELSGSC